MNETKQIGITANCLSGHRVKRSEITGVNRSIPKGGGTIGKGANTKHKIWNK